MIDPRDLLIGEAKAIAAVLQIEQVNADTLAAYASFSAGGTVAYVAPSDLHVVGGILDSGGGANAASFFVNSADSIINGVFAGPMRRFKFYTAAVWVPGLNFSVRRGETLYITCSAACVVTLLMSIDPAQTPR